VQEALDNQRKAIGIFLDLSKAYDVINHKTLLDKLDSYGVRGTINNWFKSFLSRRTQVVEISYLNKKNSLQEKLQSSPSEIEHGVPQGSILGPLLFLLYINDLPSHINEAKLVLYADDTNILVTGKNEEELQTRISVITKQLEGWLCENDLVVNTTKTVAMSFHSSQLKIPLKPNIFLQNSKIAYKSEVKFLGIYIMENLNWHGHVKFLCSSLSKTYYMIRALKQTVSTYILWNIYFAHFQSKVTYGVVVWRRSRESTKILRLQKKVVRMMTGLKTGESFTLKFKELKTLTVISLYMLEVLSYMKKYRGSITENSVIHEHNTRRKTDLHIQSCRTSLFQKSVINIVIKLFNHLPSELKQLHDFNSLEKN
jgi:hypothetical protein